MKKILAVLLLTIVSLAGHAQSGQRIYTALMPIQGSTYAQLIPSASVYTCVYNSSLSCVTPINIYSDKALQHPITQPLIADPKTAVYQYYIQSGTLLVEKVCAPYNQCTSNAVFITGGVGGVSSIIPGSNITCAIDVSGKCAGDVTINASAGLDIQTNGIDNSLQSLLNHVDTSTVKWTNTSGGIESASVPNATNSSLGAAECDGTTTTCSGGIISAELSGALANFIVPPRTDLSYTILYPTSSSITGTDGANCTGTVSNTSGGIVRTQSHSIGSHICSMQWGGFSLPAGLSAGSIQYIYAVSVASLTGNVNRGFVSLSCTSGAQTASIFAAINHSLPPATYSGLMSGTASTFNYSTAACSASDSSSTNYTSTSYDNFNTVALMVFYTGTSGPITAVQVVNPLSYNAALNTLYLSLPYDYALDTGAADALVVSLSAYTAPSPGTTVKVLPAHANATTTPTLNLNGLVTATITKIGGSALVAGDLSTTAVAVMIFDGTNWELQNPQTTSSNTVNVNGSPVSNPNFNGTTPAAETNGKNIAYQVSASSVSGEIVGDGNAAHYLDGTGNYSIPTGTSGLSGMNTGQVGVAGSPTTITSSKAIAGSGAGLTSGPTSSTSGDVATFSGTSGQIQDSSVLLSSLALLASPTFTGVPAAPTATGGTNTTQLATTAFVQAAIAAAGTGAGIVTYSGPSLTFTGTQYFPIGGGATSSTTETNVDIDSPAAVTIQNMTVQMSAAPGVGASIVFTWRKNAAGTVLTCTISGASATSCSDTTHNFTTAALDLLDIQTVTTGSVVGTPTVVMAAQVGIAATATTAFSAISGGTNTAAAMIVGSGASLAPSGSGTISANQLNAVPFCTGFTPTNGQNLQYTTASSPNPCYTAVTPSATSTGYTGVNGQSASYTTVLGDAGGYIRMNVASANTVTIPLNATVAYTVGTTITIIQVGAGQTTIVATGGVTINTPTSLAARAQWSTIMVTKVATDTWDAAGDLQ